VIVARSRGNRRVAWLLGMTTKTKGRRPERHRSALQKQARGRRDAKDGVCEGRKVKQSGVEPPHSKKATADPSLKALRDDNERRGRFGTAEAVP